MRKPLFRPIFISWLAIPVTPKTRSQKFRAWLEKWLPVRFGPRTWDYPCGGIIGPSEYVAGGWTGCQVYMSEDNRITFRQLESEETA
jgi:hypothetical protein